MAQLYPILAVLLPQIVFKKIHGTPLPLPHHQHVVKLASLLLESSAMIISQFLVVILIQLSQTLKYFLILLTPLLAMFFHNCLPFLSFPLCFPGLFFFLS